MKLSNKFIQIFSVTIYLLIISCPLLKYLSLHSTYYDLGIYTNLLSQNGGSDKTIGGHVNLYLPVLSILYKLIPDGFKVISILLLQSLGIIYGLALIKKHFGNLIFFIASISYPIWFSVLFDFHFEFIGFVLLTLFYISVKNRVPIGCLVFSLLLAILKEPYAIMSAFCGLYLLAIKDSDLSPFSSQRQAFAISIAIISASVFYFYITFGFHLTKYKPDEINANNYYSAISSHFLEDFTSLNINGKSILFFVLPFVSYCTYICKDIRPLIVVVPVLSAALFSNSSLHASFNSHYSLIMVPAFVYTLYINIIKNTVCVLYKDASMFISAAISIFFSPVPFFANFWYGYVSAYSYKSYVPSKTTTLTRNYLDSIFCNDKTSSVTIQNSLITECMVNRQNLYPFPAGISKGITYPPGSNGTYDGKLSDYVTIDTSKKLYIYDSLIKDDAGYKKFSEFLRIVINEYNLYNCINDLCIYKRKVHKQ